LYLGGRKGIVAECSQDKLEHFVGMMVPKTFLEDMLKCTFEDEDGNPLKLDDQLFLVLKDIPYCYKLVSLARAVAIKNDDQYCLVFY